MDVNALNFCRFSLLKVTIGEEDSKALIALPNLVDSSTVCVSICLSPQKSYTPFLKKVDIWSLPTRDRIHATIGQEIQKSIFSANPGGRNTSGPSFLYV
jgi:ASTRA-associated protein 1